MSRLVCSADGCVLGRSGGSFGYGPGYSWELPFGLGYIIIFSSSC